MKLIFCLKCRKEDKHYARGLCKRCYKREYNKAYKEKNRDRVRKKNKEWRLKNKDRLKESRRKYYLEHQEEIKKVAINYHKDNKARMVKCAKKYRLKNLGKIRFYQKKWRRSFEGKLWRKINRAERRSGDDAKTINRVVNENLLRYGVIKCENCRNKCVNNYEIDHIIPIKKGGNNNYENLQVLCKKCNLEKHVYACDHRLIIENDQIFLKEL